jgi:hypothetical protein
MSYNTGGSGMKVYDIADITTFCGPEGHRKAIQMTMKNGDYIQFYFKNKDVVE